MSERPALQLRIHSGAHAGASEALDATSQLIGAGLDCDFVLVDAGLLALQARLDAGPLGWRLLCWTSASDEPGAGVDMVPGALYAIGPVVISIDSPQAPWPGPEAVAEALLARVPDAGAAPKGVDPGAVAGADARSGTAAPDQTDAGAALPIGGAGGADGPGDGADQAGETGYVDGVGASGGSPRRVGRGAGALSRSTMSSVIAALVCLIVGSLLWVLWPKGQLDGGDAATVAGAAATGSAASAAVASGVARLGAGGDAIDTVIRSLALSQRVSVEQGVGGQPVVRAALLSDDEYEQLALALSRLSPRPALAVTTEQELGVAVKELVEREALELKTGLSARQTGVGRYQIVGKLGDAKVRDALLQRLRDGLPAVVVLEPALTLPEDVAQRLMEDLRNAKLADIDGQWQDGRLRMQVSLLPTDVPRWEQLLASAARKHDVPFTVALKLRTAPATNRLPEVLASLPFKLQSVVSGDTPYVVVGDGAKLLLEGSLKGWRLVSIDPASVVFEGDNASRIVVNR